MSAAAIEPALEAAPPGTQDLVLERSLVTWVSQDPRGAARFAELQADPFLREVSLRTVARSWARADSEEATRWAVSLVERDPVIEHVALELAPADSRAALRLLERRDRHPPLDIATVGVVSRWASQDFPAACSWLEAQAPSPTRDEIAQQLAFMATEWDAPRAGQWADRMIIDEAVRKNAFASIARLWGTRDPDAAREWAASLEPGTRERVEQELALLARTEPSN